MFVERKAKICYFWYLLNVIIMLLALAFDSHTHHFGISHFSLPAPRANGKSAQLESNEMKKWNCRATQAKVSRSALFLLKILSAAGDTDYFPTTFFPIELPRRPWLRSAPAAAATTTSQLFWCKFNFNLTNLSVLLLLHLLNLHPFRLEDDRSK